MLRCISRVTAALVVAISLVWTVPAFGTAQLLADNRIVEIEAAVVEGPNSSGFGPSLVAAPFGVLFDETLASGPFASLPQGRSIAAATAIQESSFNASPTFESISASGSAEATGSVAGGSFLAEASSYAQSAFNIEFSLDTPTNWSLSATIFDSGSESTAFVRLRPVGGSDIFILQGDGNSSAGDSGVLAPGDYELIATAEATGFVDLSSNPSSFDRDASYTLVFAIPEPSTGLTMVVTGMLVLGRRPKR